MTMPDDSELVEDAPQDEDAHSYLVGVRIVENVARIERQAIADFGSWVTYSIVSGGQPVTALNRNVRRRSATLFVSATVAAQPITDGLLVGTFAQVTNQKGGFLPIGAKVTIENQQQLFAVFPTGNANPVNLTVLDELYYGE